MGYTRYFELTGKRFEDEDGEMFFNIVKNIIDNAKKMYDIDIFDGWGENKPVINKEYLALNGDASKGLECETFEIMPAKYYSSNNDGFDFCKTRCQPYDVVVNAILKVAEALQFVKNVHADGDNEEEKAEVLFSQSIPDDFMEYTNMKNTDLGLYVKLSSTKVVLTATKNGGEPQKFIQILDDLAAKYVDKDLIGSYINITNPDNLYCVSEEEFKEYRVSCYKKRIFVTTEILDWISILLDLTADQIRDRFEYRRDTTLYSETAVFPNNYEMDVKLCNSDGDGYPWTEAVLFQNNSEVCCSEIDDTFDGIWELEDEGIVYKVEIINVVQNRKGE